MATSADMQTVVLVHGFLGFDRLFGIEYFKGVAEHLRARDPALQILAPKLDPDAPIAHRARQLLDFMAVCVKSKAHIIAHSMGGLDARYLISKLGGYRLVRSLTTLGTPHWGTPAAEWLIRIRVKFGDAAAASVLTKSARARIALSNRHIRYLLDVLCPFDGGIHDMTYRAMERFNEACPNLDSVAYFSHAGLSGPGERDSLSPLLAPFHGLILKCDHPKMGGKNDGLVSIESAKGKGLGKGGTDFQFSGILHADHCDLIGHDWSISSRLIKRLVGKRNGFDHLKLYERIVRRVKKL